MFCGTDQTVIVTGRTLKSAVQKKLEEYEYGALGQLYSPTRGINFLIRNLLWNPPIRFLIVVNATKEDKNSGAVQCLLDFFREGFECDQIKNDSYCWKIISSVTGYTDIEIPFENLQRLRESIDCHEVKSGVA